jgi:hypothetical protein
MYWSVYCTSHHLPVLNRRLHVVACLCQRGSTSLLRAFRWREALGVHDSPPCAHEHRLLLVLVLVLLVLATTSTAATGTGTGSSTGTGTGTGTTAANIRSCSRRRHRHTRVATGAMHREWTTDREIKRHGQRRQRRLHAHAAIGHRQTVRRTAAARVRKPRRHSTGAVADVPRVTLRPERVAVHISDWSSGGGGTTTSSMVGRRPASVPVRLAGRQRRRRRRPGR